MSGARNRIVYNKEDLDRFLTYLKSCNGNLTLAARKAGFRNGRQTILDLMDKYKWFEKAVDNIMDELFDEIEQHVVKKAKTKLSAGKFLLTYHKKGRERGYGKRNEITGKDGAPLSFVDMVSEDG